MIDLEEIQEKFERIVEVVEDIDEKLYEIYDKLSSLEKRISLNDPSKNTQGRVEQWLETAQKDVLEKLDQEK